MYIKSNTTYGQRHCQLFPDIKKFIGKDVKAWEANKGIIYLTGENTENFFNITTHVLTKCSTFFFFLKFSYIFIILGCHKSISSTTSCYLPSEVIYTNLKIM